ncbi:MAG TPA: response regulator, partial [Terriglobales bacterium]|nr:response regulator [Terriglobales bacterium]
MTPEKILIVDDEENERAGLAELVSSWGYRTEVASDGLDGLDKVSSWNPAIVITDLKMPRMDGLELLRRLAELPAPVIGILMTAQGSGEVGFQAGHAGAYDYIEKPINFTRLKAILRNATTHRSDQIEKEILKEQLKNKG